MFLRTAFTHVVPKSVKRLTPSLSLLRFLGSARLKAVRRTLMKLTPVWEPMLYMILVSLLYRLIISHLQMVHGKARTASVAVAAMVIPQHEEEEEDDEVSI